MKTLIAIIINLMMACTNLGAQTTLAPLEDDYTKYMKQDLLVLMISYPQHITNIEIENDKVYCITSNNRKILYDDKKIKSHNEKLTEGDLQDALEQIYPLELINKIPEKDFEPGRIRCYPLLNEVYGSNEATIKKNLKTLTYGYTNYSFNSKNGANTSLENALKEIMPQAKTRSDIANILYPPSGTFNYRTISGTGRLSPHAYAIAIDLKTDPRDYWKWSTADKGLTRILEYPEELVKAFEGNGFVWGGKWNHFDTLHFEFRPEIINKAKFFGNYDSTTPWYTGAPETEEVQKLIKTIDEAFKGR